MKHESEMKIAGIVTEYNPFHNGHAYQIGEVRRLTDADYIVAAMSGDFVQRGAPALTDKYARCEMALAGGVDLVVELPSLWAVSTAELFATAGVTLFDIMGCVGYLCFGGETDDLALLSSPAKLLSDEPESFRTELTANLKTGMSFPAAREAALHTPKGLLDTPNNILALEYLKALKKRSSGMTPVLIPRSGASHHATATAIRSLLLSDSPLPDDLSGSLLPDDLSDLLPSSALSVLRAYSAASAFLTPDDFSEILGWLLLSETPESLRAYADCNESLANRIANHTASYCSFSDFCIGLKSRNTTYTGISRVLMHMILRHTAEDYGRAHALGDIPYLRILGFRESAAPLLKIIKKSAGVPLLTRPAEAKKLLTPAEQTMFQKDIFSANLYEQVRAAKSKKSGKTNTLYCPEHRRHVPIKFRDITT